jgi:vacuolar-type H+-ATPase catalytic subunit A/Vma1
MITIMLVTLLLFVSVYSIALYIQTKKLKKECYKNYDINVENEKKYDMLLIAYEKQKSLVENRNNIIKKMYDSMIGDLENISNMSSNNFEAKYDVDDILNEINEKGIENVDKDKINYLNNIKKQR